MASPGPSRLRSESPPNPGSLLTGPPVEKRRNFTALELQRLQLEKLLKNPDKEVFIPGGPKEKTLRAPREMMKNVQGSSAGAGSGEFHVYKQNRRREYERLKLMDEKAKSEEEAAAFAFRQKTRQEEADAKTAKNRAKRLKRKGKGGGGGATGAGGEGASSANLGDAAGDGPAGKKRKLGGGAGSMAFRRPGAEDSEDEEDGEEDGPHIGETGGEEAPEAAIVDTNGGVVIVDEY